MTLPRGLANFVMNELDTKQRVERLGVKEKEYEQLDKYDSKDLDRLERRLKLEREALELQKEKEALEKEKAAAAAAGLVSKACTSKHMRYAIHNPWYCVCTGQRHGWHPHGGQW